MIKRKLKAFSYAKINLSLNVSGKNPDGYHLLDSVTASVNIADAVTVCARFDSAVNVTYNGRVSPYKDDTVLKAIDCLRRRFGDFGVDVAVDKKLPHGAGVGGSSADASAVIVLLEQLYGFDERGFNRACTALEVGSDVPLMAQGGFSRLKGIGGTVERLNSPSQLFAVLVTGESGISTAQCFSRFDAIHPDFTFCPSDNQKLTQALEDGDFSALCGQCGNALTEAAASIDNSITQRLKALKEAGAAASFMTGSGSGCAGLFPDFDFALDAEMRLSKSGYSAQAIKTVSRGVKII